jgi:L-glyceraldehyde 3-phosphate reductase
MTQLSQTFSKDRYDKMKYRRCGRSGLMLPAVSLGAWETYGGTHDGDVAKLIALSQTCL